VRPGTILTDAASVKVAVVAALEARWTTTGPVVGAHPIAGSEASGAEAARGDLFRGRRCIVTPTPTSDRAAVARVAELWAGVGASVEEMTPAVHDEILARVSHLPHVVAYALVGAVGDMVIDGRRTLDYAGTGFRDTTRIAASPVPVWRDILLANVTPVRAALAELRVELDELERLLAAGDAAGLEAVIGRARDVRRRFGTGES
jgi:prephenate dehydrogenase